MSEEASQSVQLQMIRDFTSEEKIRINFDMETSQFSVADETCQCSVADGGVCAAVGAVVGAEEAARLAEAELELRPPRVQRRPQPRHVHVPRVQLQPASTEEELCSLRAEGLRKNRIKAVGVDRPRSLHQSN